MHATDFTNTQKEEKEAAISKCVGDGKGEEVEIIGGNLTGLRGSISTLAIKLQLRGDDGSVPLQLDMLHTSGSAAAEAGAFWQVWQEGPADEGAMPYHTLQATLAVQDRFFRISDPEISVPTNTKNVCGTSRGTCTVPSASLCFCFVDCTAF